MASIKDSKRIVKRVYLSNLSSDEGLNITPLLVGPHGIGKSQVVKRCAEDLGGFAITVEGGSLKEGEITGLPFAQQDADGSSEVRFIKYFAINRLFQLEKFYYEKASTVGFLNGEIKLEKDTEGNEFLICGSTKTKVRTAVFKIRDGEDNRFKFGNELPSSYKLKLIESGEIEPCIFFIDELNRTEMTTQKELMNIILNKSVNGYNLPWWCQIVSAINPSSQNSSYATNEFDDAQLDRFLKIKTDANLEDWIDYQLEKHVGENTDCIEALAVAENIFVHKDKSLEDQSEMYPSPRSWEMVMHLYNTIHQDNETKFFSADEKKKVDDDLRVLIRGKVGETAARTLLETISRKENNIKASEILTCKSLKLDEAIVEKYNKQKSLVKTIIASNVVTYMQANIADLVKGKTSADPKEKEKYMNFMSQLKEFSALMDPSTQVLFVKNIIAKDLSLYTKISKAFSQEILTQVMSNKADFKNMIEEE